MKADLEDARPSERQKAYLRRVQADGYTLTTWDTETRDNLGKWILGYQLNTPEGKALFWGEDFSCSPMHAVDSDDALRALLGFLTLAPGDTDAEYFANYTPEQLAFAQGDAGTLQGYALEPERCQRCTGEPSCPDCGGTGTLGEAPPDFTELPLPGESDRDFADRVEGIEEAHIEAADKLRGGKD